MKKFSELKIGEQCIIDGNTWTKVTEKAAQMIDKSGHVFKSSTIFLKTGAIVEVVEK